MTKGEIDVKKVYGVGINDSKSPTIWSEIIIDENGDEKKIRKRCPFYQRWINMLLRCYGEKTKIRQPSYNGCYVVDEWLLFSNFKKWMERQDWNNKHLDKDILYPKNRAYGPDTCVFVSREVNSFLLERNSSRGKYPIGVIVDNRKKKKYRAACGAGKGNFLGYFSTPEEAHSAWLDEKLRLAKILAEKETDERIANALVDRYMNYSEWFGET